MKEEGAKSGNLFDLRILKRLFVFVKPYVVLFYFLILLTILSAILGPLRPLIIQDTVDKYIQKGDLPGLELMSIVLIGLLIIHAIIDYIHTFISGLLGQNIVRDIRIQLYEHLLKFRLKYYDKTPIGRLITRNISDIEILSNVFSEGFAEMVGDLLQIIFILGLMFYTSWKLTLVSLCTFPILLICTYIFKEKIKVSFNEVRTAVANLNTFVQEHITGMNIVQIFNSEKREYEKFKEINKEHNKANLKSVLYYAVYFPVAEVILAVCTGLLVWYGATHALKNVNLLPSDVTLGTIIAFMMYVNMFFRPIRMIADRFNTLQMGIVSSDRIFKILDSNEEIEANGKYHPSDLKGSVQFKNVWFAYINEDYVLKDISFEVKEGETLAFVGATGAGKSSIINLLNRFYEINKGQILIDGIDIKEYDVEFLRSRISIVLQDVFLFSDTIANNISLNNKSITEEKMWQSAEMVGARKFIDRLPGKFSYNVMERGSTLSVGQRQLISFIRSMVSDPRIIVLDEATSSVDSETEELIQGAIEKSMTGRTAIIIAHRLSTIQKANKIIVLDKGEIKEIGTHEDLLKLNGFYFQLNKMQFTS